jgi:hypothetical protein
MKTLSSSFYADVRYVLAVPSYLLSHFKGIE